MWYIIVVSVLVVLGVVIMSAMSGKSKVFKVTVDYDLTLPLMIEAGKYACVDNNITSPHFPVDGKGKQKSEVVLFHFFFKQVTSFDKMKRKMEKAGYCPARIEVLLALGVQHPELHQLYIAGLGSVWRNAPGDCYAPFIRPAEDRGSGLRREVGLTSDMGNCCTWGRSCRFAAVRQGDLERTKICEPSVGA